MLILTVRSGWYIQEWDGLLPQTLELTRDGSVLHSVLVSTSYRIRDEISTNSGSNDHELI